MKCRRPVRRIIVAVVASRASLSSRPAVVRAHRPLVRRPAPRRRSTAGRSRARPNLGNGTVKTYVRTGEGGRAVEVGLRLSESAVEGLPANTLRPTCGCSTSRSSGSDGLRPRHDELEPTGARPRRPVGKPHFDFHFDMADMATLGALIILRDYAMKADHLPERVWAAGTWCRWRRSVRGAGRARYGGAPGRLQRHQPRSRLVQLPADRHQWHLGRSLHLRRADGHARLVVDQAHPGAAATQAAAGLPEEGLLPHHLLRAVR